VTTYITSVRVQRALIARREIDAEVERQDAGREPGRYQRGGRPTVAQWCAAYAGLGRALAELDAEEAALYREVAAAQ
jgi:hypothetical protein